MHLMDRANEELLLAVKVHCVRLSSLVLSKSQSPERPILLSSGVRELYHGIIQGLEAVNTKFYHLAESRQVPIGANVAEYVYFLIASMFRLPNLTDGTLEYMLRVLEILIRQCWTAGFNEDLMMMISLISYSITDRKGNRQQELQLTLSTGLQYAGAACAAALCQTVIVHGRQKEFFSKNQSAVAHFISSLLEIVISSLELDVALESLQALDSIVFGIIADKKLMTMIFPGIISKLMKYVIEGKRKGLTIESVIQFLGKLLVYLLDNEDYKPLDKATGSEATHTLSVKDDTSENWKLQQNKLGLQLRGHVQWAADEVRTSEWLKGTIKNLETYIPRLIQKSFQYNEKLKLAVESFCQELLFKCSNVLSRELNVALLDLILTIRGNNTGEGSFLVTPFVKSLLLESLNNSMDLVRSLLYSADANEGSTKINKIRYSIQLLIENGDSQEQAFSEPLVDSIVSEIILLENTHRSRGKSGKVKDFKVAMSTQFPQYGSTKADLGALVLFSAAGASGRLEFSGKELALFQSLDFQVENSLKLLLQSLGYSRYAGQIVESILLKQGNSGLSKAVSLWVCNCIVVGMQKSGRVSELGEEVEFDTNQFLTYDQNDEVDEAEETLLVQSNDNIETADSILTAVELAQNLISSIAESSSEFSDTIGAISLDTIGIASLVFQASFKSELIDNLYLVVENLASDSPILRLHAQNAMLQITRNLYSNDLVSELILKNSDYLLDSLNLRLVNQTMGPDTLRVLIVLIQISGVKIIEKLGDVVDSSFVLLDMYHGYSALSNGIFEAMSEILNTVVKSYLLEYDFEQEVFRSHQEEILQRMKPWGMKNREELFNLLDNSKKELPYIEEPDSDDEQVQKIKEIDSDDDETQVDQSEELFAYKSHIPKHTYLLMQRIASYCIRFIQYPSFRLQIQIFHMLNKLFPILATQMTELYPLLYQFWDYILAACLEEDIRMNIAGFSVMNTMLQFGGTFLNKNFISLWKSLQSSKNFKTYKEKTKVAKTAWREQRFELAKFQGKVYPTGLEKDYSIGVTQILRQGLTNCGDALDLTMVVDIMEFGIGGIEWSSFSSFQDVAWYIENHG